MNTIPALFANSVERYGTSIALLEPEEQGGIASVSFRELADRVSRFAGHLQSLQVAKGDRLLIWSTSRIDWLVAYFGGLLAGMIIVPLDLNTKETFLQRIAQTTEAKFLITTQKQYQSLNTPPVPLIDIEALPGETLDKAKLPEIVDQDLAEIVFTSGTTGQPKGVMLSHANTVSNADAALQVVPIESRDRALSILPLSHMFEMTIELALLRKGASILYARSLNPEVLLKLLGSQRVTVMVLVPQALQLFLNGIEREVRRQKRERQWQFLQRIAHQLPFNWRHLLFRPVHRRFGGHFRFFVSGGAYLPPTLAQAWENLGFRILAGYGATECSPIVTVTPMNAHKLDTVGRVLPGVEVRIAKDGEILVHGPNVAQGYWKNPEATAAAFEDCWYHTGDLGYFDSQRNLYLKGRKKNLIVLANGMNVYPEDIENVLATLPEVKDAVVFGLNEGDRGPEVHSVLLLDNPAQAKSIVQQANKQLAAHQQIKGFTVWPEKDFPRTHTLKVKRQDVLEQLPALREPSPFKSKG